MTQRTIDKSIVNLSGYIFTELVPEELQPKIKERGDALAIRGTVLLSTEGLNTFFAGTEAAAQAFSDFLFKEAGIPPFELKKSYSDYVPFRKLLVKIKREIINTGRTDLQPTREKAPYIQAAELNDWYETEKEFIMLDTRNDYEIKLGKFRNAVDLGVTTFKKFIAKSAELPPEWKDKPIVTYCTGGIRCEKAALLLQQQGFTQVRQLHGGILKYFEESGSKFFDGECFVFDKRIGVNGNLHETDTTQCYACRSPLLPRDIENEFYVYEKSCPYCKKLKRPQE